MPKTEPEETAVDTQTSSRKREVTAVATATLVTIVVGVASQVLTGKLAGLVQQKINPQKTD